jgi:hypothetical protein
MAYQIVVGTQQPCPRLVGRTKVSYSRIWLWLQRPTY